MKLSVLTFLLVLFVGCSQVNAQHTSSAGETDFAPAIAGTNGSMTPQGMNDPHMEMTPVWPFAAGDAERANRIALETERAIAQYHDIEVAQEAGFIQFPPDATGFDIVHYIDPWGSFLENWGIDPERPGSLLYERSGGSWRLLGAMFTAPAEASLEELDARVPLSVTRWHLHTNICVPDPIWDVWQWEKTRDGKPLFGPESPVATREACDALGGEFHPTMFGWMVHVNVFADNPADVWNPMYGHDEGGH